MPVGTSGRNPNVQSGWLAEARTADLKGGRYVVRLLGTASSGLSYRFSHYEFPVVHGSHASQTPYIIPFRVRLGKTITTAGDP